MIRLCVLGHTSQRLWSDSRGDEQDILEFVEQRRIDETFRERGKVDIRSS